MRQAKIADLKNNLSRYLDHVRSGGSVLVLMQLAILLRTWTGTVPTASDRAAGDRYLAFLRQIDGEVLIWHQRFVETKAGKQSWGLEMAAEDILRADDVPVSTALKGDIVRACRTERMAGVIDPPDWLQQAVALGTPVDLFDDPAVFRPIAGALKRPARYFPIVGSRAGHRCRPEGTRPQDPLLAPRPDTREHRPCAARSLRPAGVGESRSAPFARRCRQ